MLRRVPMIITFAVLIIASNVALSDSHFGPSGGHEGSEFVDIVPPGARITEIRIHSGERIDAIQVIYAGADGRPIEMPRHGGSGGGLEVLRLGRGEYINEIKGRYGARLDSLTIGVEGKRADWTGFHAGGSGGSADFRYQAPYGMEIIGFRGRSGAELDAIGVVLRKR